MGSVPGQESPDARRGHISWAAIIGDVAYPTERMETPDGSETVNNEQVGESRGGDGIRTDTDYEVLLVGMTGRSERGADEPDFIRAPKIKAVKRRKGRLTTLVSSTFVNTEGYPGKTVTATPIKVDAGAFSNDIVRCMYLNPDSYVICDGYRVLAVAHSLAEAKHLVSSISPGDPMALAVYYTGSTVSLYRFDGSLTPMRGPHDSNCEALLEIRRAEIERAQEEEAQQELDKQMAERRKELETKSQARKEAILDQLRTIRRVSGGEETERSDQVLLALVQNVYDRLLDLGYGLGAADDVYYRSMMYEIAYAYYADWDDGVYDPLAEGVMIHDGDRDHELDHTDSSTRAQDRSESTKGNGKAERDHMSLLR